MMEDGICFRTNGKESDVFKLSRIAKASTAANSEDMHRLGYALSFRAVNIKVGEAQLRKHIPCKIDTTRIPENTLPEVQSLVKDVERNNDRIEACGLGALQNTLSGKDGQKFLEALENFDVNGSKNASTEDSKQAAERYLKFLQKDPKEKQKMCRRVAQTVYPLYLMSATLLEGLAMANNMAQWGGNYAPSKNQSKEIMSWTKEPTNIGKCVKAMAAAIEQRRQAAGNKKQNVSDDDTDDSDSKSSKSGSSDSGSDDSSGSSNKSKKRKKEKSKTKSKKNKKQKKDTKKQHESSESEDTQQRDAAKPRGSKTEPMSESAAMMIKPMPEGGMATDVEPEATANELPKDPEHQNGGLAQFAVKHSLIEVEDENVKTAIIEHKTSEAIPNSLAEPFIEAQHNFLKETFPDKEETMQAVSFALEFLVKYQPQLTAGKKGCLVPEVHVQQELLKTIPDNVRCCAQSLPSNEIMEKGQKKVSPAWRSQALICMSFLAFAKEYHEEVES